MTERPLPRTNGLRRGPLGRAPGWGAPEKEGGDQAVGVGS
jgi:hypothetical protein